jgi:sugar O-acyltransferase (sialic acid O-acetyltransferase NeuD family)
MTRDLLIYGAGGAGRNLASKLSSDEQAKTGWKVRGFIDDTKSLQGQTVNTLPVLGGFEYLMDYDGNIAVTIVDTPALRRKLVTKIRKNKNISFPVIIVPKAIVSSYVEYGEGCIISPTYGLVSVNVKLGDFVHVLGSTRVGYDATVGDFTTLFTGILLGGGSVGSECVIGSGAIILPKVKIGDGSIIGAGSVVTKDIPPNVVAAGVNVLVDNAKLGNFVYIQGGNSIGHDVVIGDFTTVFTGIIFGGGASVGSQCVIGEGAIIRPKAKIGEGSIIEAGSVVVEDIPPNVVAAGVPAKIIKKIK